ncbi:MAG: hypothetical protein V8R64_06545 [Thomasclavelia sp.]
MVRIIRWHLLTTAVQSSAAVIAIAQQMYGSGAIGLSIAYHFYLVVTSVLP